MASITENHVATARQMLGKSALCRGLSIVEVVAIAEAVRPVSLSSGQIICRQEEPGDRMYIVGRGRIKLTLETGGGPYRLLEYLGKGDHFGELAVLTDGVHPATASAVTDCVLLELDQSRFDQLMRLVPGFAANLSRSLGFRLRSASGGKARRRKPKIVALINSTHRTQGLVRPLAKALVERGNSIEVLTDRPEKWPTEGEYLIERIPDGLAGPAKAELVRERLLQVIEHHDRILLDLTQKNIEHELPSLLAQCEEIWWLVDSAFAATGRRNLERLLASDPLLAGRIHVVWILHESEKFAPSSMRDLNVAEPDFKVVLGETGSPARDQGVLRLVRHLQGTRLGLALGGGGARGLAHLGVLREFDRAGISFDLLAGTSSGALMGLSYAAGWAPDDALAQFNEHLTPHRLFRSLPGGLYWYLWLMFRGGRWDRKLRPYLGDTTLEQLQIPMATVAVDLVTGNQVVRERGDAIHAVLESINLPPIARPILRDGMALLDGGVLNNLPADVLTERGADLVVGIDVVSKLRPVFAKNVPSTGTAKMRRPGIVETLMRINEVQDHGLATRGARSVDLMIAPDTSAFEFADFSQGYPLAEAGEAAAAEAVPQLKQMLADLEKS